MWPYKFYNEEEMEENILTPFTHISLVAPYDFLTKKFSEAFDYWLKVPQEKLKQIQEITTMLKAAYAIMDDMQDTASFRRTAPAAQAIFGTPLTINATVHVYLLVLEKIIKLEHPKAVEIFCQSMLHSLRGQGTDIYWRETQLCPNEDEYKQMAANKTGGFILLSIQLMQLFSENKTDYNYIVLLFSVYYEIRDDYVNLAKQEALEERSSGTVLENINEVQYCEDFTDGKLSWPILHSTKSPKRSTILALLKTRPRDVRTKRYLLSLLEEVGSMEYTKHTIRQLEKDLLSEIAAFGGNPLLEHLISELQNWDNL